jgi:DNA-directed RNA polymerase specialized sigma24 family protein
LRSQNRAAMAALLDSFVLLLSRSGTCDTFAGLSTEALAAQYRALGEGPGLLTLCALALSLRARLLGIAYRYSSADPGEIVYTHLAASAKRGAADIAKDVRSQLHHREEGEWARGAREEAYQAEVLSLQAEPQAETALRTREVAQALATLTPEERGLLGDVEDGIPQEDLARREGVSLRTIERRIQAVREKLKRLLFV